MPLCRVVLECCPDSLSTAPSAARLRMETSLWGLIGNGGGFQQRCACATAACHSQPRNWVEASMCLSIAPRRRRWSTKIASVVWPRRAVRFVPANSRLPPLTSGGGRGTVLRHSGARQPASLPAHLPSGQLRTFNLAPIILCFCNLPSPPPRLAPGEQRA